MAGEWNWTGFKVPSNPNQSVILQYGGGGEEKNFQGQQKAFRQYLGRNVKEGKVVTDSVMTLAKTMSCDEDEQTYFNHALKQFTVKDSPHSYEV